MPTASAADEVLQLAIRQLGVEHVTTIAPHTRGLVDSRETWLVGDLIPQLFEADAYCETTISMQFKGKKLLGRRPTSRVGFGFGV